MLSFLRMFTDARSLIDKSGNIVYGFKRYTEFHLGNINILISVPHDGSSKPIDIHDRQTDNQGNFKNDFNTRNVAISIKNELSDLFLSKKDFKALPFVVMNNLHRLFIFKN